MVRLTRSLTSHPPREFTTLRMFSIGSPLKFGGGPAKLGQPAAARPRRAPATAAPIARSRAGRLVVGDARVRILARLVFPSRGAQSSRDESLHPSPVRRWLRSAHPFSSTPSLLWPQGISMSPMAMANAAARTGPRATEACSPGWRRWGSPSWAHRRHTNARPIPGRGNPRGRARMFQRTTRTTRRRARRHASWTSSSPRESWQAPCAYGLSTSRISGAQATTAAWRSRFRNEACARPNRLRGMEFAWPRVRATGPESTIGSAFACAAIVREHQLAN